MLLTDGKTFLRVEREGCSFFHDEMGEDEIIPVPLELHPYFLSAPNTLTNEELREYILFYDFLGNEKNVALAVYEFVCVRQVKVSLHPLLDEWLIPVYEDTFFAKKGYDELSKVYEKNRRNNGCYYSAREGNLPLLKYFHEKYKNEKAPCYADERGVQSVEILRYIHENIRSLSMSLAYSPKNMDVFKYMYSIAKQNKHWYTYISAQDGSVEAAEFLISQGQKFRNSDIAWAFTRGHLPFIEYLHSQGYEFTERMWRHAVTEGHRYILDYLRSIGVKFTQQAAVFATNRNTQKPLKMLKYFHSHGCKLSHTLVRVAIEAQSKECFEYLHSLGLRCKKACYTAILCDDVEMLKLVLEKGYRLKSGDIKLATQRDYYPINNFLREYSAK